MPIPCSLEGFDVSGAVDRMLGEPLLWWQTVGLFVGHFADWEAAWEAVIGEDARERKQVHALRSAAANVGASRLAERAGELEACLLARLAGGAGMVPEALRHSLLAEFRRAWQVAADAWQAGDGGGGS